MYTLIFLQQWTEDPIWACSGGKLELLSGSNEVVSSAEVSESLDADTSVRSSRCGQQ